MKESIMFDKPALLLVVIAIFIAAIWLLDHYPSTPSRYTDWPKPRPDSRRHFAYTLAMREPVRMNPGGTWDAQDVIRRLHQESGSY
jgi:hypothetical protein